MTNLSPGAIKGFQPTSFIKQKLLRTNSGRLLFLVMIPFIIFGAWFLGGVMLKPILKLLNHIAGDGGPWVREVMGRYHIAQLMLGLWIPYFLFSGVRDACLETNRFVREGSLLGHFPFVSYLVLSTFYLIKSIPLCIAAALVAQYFIGGVVIGLIGHVIDFPGFPVVASFIFVAIFSFNVFSDSGSSAGPAKQEIEKGRGLGSRDEAEREGERLFGEHRDK